MYWRIYSPSRIVSVAMDMIKPREIGRALLTVWSDLTAGPVCQLERGAYLNLIRNERATQKKQPTGHGPEGCDENGPAAALPILTATKAMLFMGQDTSS